MLKPCFSPEGNPVFSTSLSFIGKLFGACSVMEAKRLPGCPKMLYPIPVQRTSESRGFLSDCCVVLGVVWLCAPEMLRCRMLRWATA